jgi:hypothetical protein
VRAGEGWWREGVAAGVGKGLLQDPAPLGAVGGGRAKVGERERRGWGPSTHPAAGSRPIWSDRSQLPPPARPARPRPAPRARAPRPARAHVRVPDAVARAVAVAGRVRVRVVPRVALGPLDGVACSGTGGVQVAQRRGAAGKAPLPSPQARSLHPPAQTLPPSPSPHPPTPTLKRERAAVGKKVFQGLGAAEGLVAELPVVAEADAEAAGDDVAAGGRFRGGGAAEGLVAELAVVAEADAEAAGDDVAAGGRVFRRGVAAGVAAGAARAS